MRKNNLQPWLDYFDMLEVYGQKGYLEVHLDKNEAFITLSALLTLSEADNPHRLLAETMPSTVRNIRAYAGWLSQEGENFLRKPFALHVVKEEQPHDLLYTVLLTKKRLWWKLFRKTERIEVIEYTQNIQ